MPARDDGERPPESHAAPSPPPLSAHSLAGAVRGPPQMMPLLALLARRAAQMSPAPSGPVHGAGEDSERCPEALTFLCDALVNGRGDTCLSQGRSSEAGESGDSAEERLRKQHVKLPFPLPFLRPLLPSTSLSSSSPSGPPTALEHRTREAVRRLGREATLVRQFVLPLLRRWRRGERKRLMEAQTGPSRQAFFKADEVNRQETNASMTQLLECVLDGIVEHQLATNTAGGACEAASDEEAHSPGELLGQLAEVTGSFRVLCIGATLLLLRRLSHAVHALHCESPKAPSQAAACNGADVARHALPNARVAAAEHATVLMAEWAQYFALHGGRVLYDAEQPEQRWEAARAGTQRSLNEGAAMDEVQWAFAVSLLARVEQQLTGHADSATPAASADLTRVFLSRLRRLLQQQARLRLSVSVASRFSQLTLTMAARSYAVTWPFLWDCAAAAHRLDKDGAAASAAEDGEGEEVGRQGVWRRRLFRADGALRWGAVLQLMGQLTATQAASEETAASSVVSTGEKGDVAGGSGAFYLGGGSDGVLGAMSGHIAACEAALLESAASSTPLTQVPAGVRKRPRDGPDSALETPQARLLRHLVFDFYAVYHPSCFTVLRGGGEHLLPQVLEGLFTLLRPPLTAAPGESNEGGDGDSDGEAIDGRDAGSDVSWLSSSFSSSSSLSPDNHTDGNGQRGEEEGAVKEMDGVGVAATAKAPPTKASASQRGTAQRLAHGQLRCHLRADPRLGLMLVHGMLLQLERRGKVRVEDSAALTAWLIPSLVALGSSNRSTASIDIDKLFLPITPRSRAGLETARWPHEQQVLFCLLVLINAGLLLALPASVAGVYLALRRYNELSRQLREEFMSSDDGSARCLQRLRSWVEEGGGGRVRARGRESSAACDAIDDMVAQTDPFFQQLANNATTLSDALLEERLRAVTPLQWPSPCGLVLAVAMYRTLCQRFYCLRNAFEEQRALAEEAEGGQAYYSRSDTFCTADDIRAFRVTVSTAHRMVFGFQPQPHGLLRLWLTYLRHLFCTLVPPAADADAIRLMPASWQQQTTVNCFDECVPRRGWRAAVQTQGTRYTSQTELRVALGAALADLVVLPLADPHALAECPASFPLARHSAEWQESQQRWSAELAQVQATLPTATLEAVCHLLAIDTEAPTPTTAGGGEIEEDVFLGLHGVVAMCQQLERRLVPGSVASPRVAHLIRCLWAAADAAALGR